MTRFKFSHLLLTGIVMVFFFACKEDLPDHNDPAELNMDEFTFIPANPVSEKEVSMIFYGCHYYVTSSVKRSQNTLTVKKRFNGAMKWPCIAEYDTISLGLLEPGNYQVVLNIVDTNPMLTDSLFLSETKKLVVY